MLVLTRKEQERIVIGEGETRIVVTVQRIEGNRVSLSVEADRKLPVHRGEVADRIAQRKAA